MLDLLVGKRRMIQNLEKVRISCAKLHCGHTVFCFDISNLSYLSYIDRRSEGSTSESRNLWVSNLSSLTRATDLKQVFSKHGKVIGAKIVTNARTPGARCYGYVTMTNSDDAVRCIKHLHRIELHGRMISVEKVIVIDLTKHSFRVVQR